MTDQRFYMVWNPHGRAPTYRHPTYQVAKEEARRLARENPGNRFIVLGALSFHATRDPVEDHEFIGSLTIPQQPEYDDPDVPF